MESDQQKPRVAIVFTGGTISMKVDREFGGVVPKLSAAEILDTVQSIHEIADIVPIEFGRYPGPHITPVIMLKLSVVVQELLNRSDIKGIVVTHGTDTLEETAYFLDLTCSSEKPIVVIGAMRNSSEQDWDGPRNLREGVRLAASSKLRGYGAIVCLSETINAASEVSKNDTTELNTFESLDFGPLGRISHGSIMLYRQPLHREYYAIDSIDAYVPLLSCYAGMDGRQVRQSIEAGAKGIVIEAFGVGNVPPAVYYELVEAVRSNIPVILVSRCPVGRIEEVYAYEGAGKHLHDNGVIFADYLNGQKARIKLSIMIAAQCSIEEIRTAFEWAEE